MHKATGELVAVKIFDLENRDHLHIDAI
jgi:serine/threonine protein kinase